MAKQGRFPSGNRPFSLEFGLFFVFLARKNGRNDKCFSARTASVTRTTLDELFRTGSQSLKE